MYKQFVFLALTLSSLVSSAQLDYKHEASGVHIAKGSNSMWQGEYDNSIDAFAKVNQSDTNYHIAQYNIVLAQYNNEEYTELEKTALAAIQDENDFTTKIYYWYIESLIKRKEFAKANVVITEAQGAFPLYFEYEYQSAKILTEKKQISEAVEVLHHVLNLHPQHSKSHYELAKIKADQGYITEAILGFEMAIISDLSSSVLQKSYLDVEDLMNNNYAITNKHKGENFFKTLDQIVKSKIALKPNYKSELGFDYSVDRQTDLLMKQFSFKESTNSFGMNYYGSFFDGVIKKGLQKGYILYMMSVIPSSEITKANSKNAEVITQFKAYFKSYWHEHQNKIKYPVGGVTYKVTHNYHTSGVLYGVGELENDVNVGDWIFFYKNGKIKSELSYNEKGELHGDCVWYDVYGNVSQKGKYENDGVNGLATFGRDNDCKWYTGTFVDNKLDGELELYRYNGTLLEKKNLSDTKLNGPWKQYSNSGTITGETNYKDGEIDGVYKSFYDNGKLYSEYNYTEGEIHGTYKKYHLNGKIAKEGKYQKGTQIGKWKRYDYNGGLESEYEFDKSGDEQGWYIKYRSNGDTLSKTPYSDGEINGIETDFYMNGNVLWEHYYKKGKLKKYINYDKLGAIISSGKKEYVLYDTFGHKYISSRLKKGKLHGLHRTYWKSGRLFKLKNYEEGFTTGNFETYYESGELEIKCTLKEGSYHGKYESFFNSGEKYAVGYYNEGDKIGEWNYYNPNGKISQKEYFTNGEVDGILTEYSIDGVKEYETKYSGNVIVRTDVFKDDSTFLKRYLTPQGNGDYSLLSPEGFKKMTSYLKGGNQDGAVTYFFPNGTKEETRSKLNGVYNGEQTVYHPNGKIQKQGNYIHGYKEGKWTAYHFNGNKLWEATYEYDVIRDSIVYYDDSGTKEKCYYYDFNGDKTKNVYYHSNGVVSSTTPFKYELVHGVLNNYSEDGKLMVSRKYNAGVIYEYSFLSEGKLLPYIPFSGTGKIEAKFDNGNNSVAFNLIDGLYEGRYVRYFSNGKICIEANYSKDEVEGKHSEYYANGNLKEEGEYSLGKLNGKHTTYYETGQVKREANYVFDDKHGVTKYFSNEGKLINTITYKDNVVIDIK